MAHEVILVEPLHDDDDATVPLVVEAGQQGVVVPVVDSLSLGFRQCFIRLQWVIDNQVVRAPAGQHTADRSGEAKAFSGRD